MSLPNGAIGQRDEMTEEQLANKHVDNDTGYVFETEEAYLDFKHPERLEKPEEPKEETEE